MTTFRRFPNLLPIAAAVFAALFLSPAARAEIPWIKAIDLRSMTPVEAEQNKPYRLRGTYIYHDFNNAVFLQDDTAGALFWHNGKVKLTPGDIVEVTGTTRSGLYVPGLAKVSYEVVGHGPVPDPIKVSYDDLISGRYHYQWVKAEGVVRSSRTDSKNHSVIRLAMGTRIVEVHVSDFDAGDLVDHRIRVTGLAAGGINDRHQLIQPYIWPRDASGIEIVSAPPPPGDLPIVSPENLLTFRPSARTGNRVKMAATVLASFSDGKVYIRDGESAAAVKLAEPADLAPGTRIEVLGFPEMESFGASLVDAEIVSRSPGTPPEPVPTWTATLLDGNLNHELVTFTARVADSFRTENGASILIATSGATVRVVTPDLAELPPPESRIRITGICEVESSLSVAYMSRPESISIFVRSPDDISMARAAAWWTTGRLTAALVAVGGICLLAILWIILLRRQVEKQTTALRDRIETEAMLMERQRIAREFHDTLEQDLTGLSLQLGAATAKASAGPERGPLDTARHLVSRIQTETRNLLHDLRTPPDQTLDLPSTLAQLAEKHSPGPGPVVEFTHDDDLPPLPPRTVHHLRMVATESVTNAIKHAEASHIGIHLSRDGGNLLMEIADDGRGFDTKSETHEKPGHFGCMGMRERSRKLGAAVTWESRPGCGTIVRVTFPLQKS